MTNYDCPKCGEIWMCNLSAAGKNVQAGYRPVFIVSNNINNKFSPVLNVIPLTSKNKKNIPVHVELNNFKEYGLHVKSTLLVEQITTVSSNDMDRYIGRITDREVFDDIKNAMAIQFPILSF